MLIRHAKAEPHGGDDVKRTLDPRGERDAREIGRWLRESQLTSGTAVVSPSRRTRQTWQLAAEELGAAPTVSHDERIYEGTVEDLLTVIRDSPPQALTLFLVGHNPGIAGLATGLEDATGDRSAAREMAAKYPTSGIAVFAVEGPWSALCLGEGHLISFTVPRG